MNWILKQEFPLKATIKIRYRGEDIPSTISKDGSVIFLEPATAPSPGQSAVIYRGQEVLGGGILQSSQ